MEKNRPTKKSNKLIWVLLLLVAALIAAVFYKSKSKPKGEAVAKEKASLRDISEIVSASGKVFPVKEIKISSDVSGEVVELYVKEGDSVTMGQILAKIDPDVYKSAVERAEASVNNAKAQSANAAAGIDRAKGSLVQAESQLDQIKAQLENTKAIHERNITLHKEGVISQADFDASYSNLKALEANIRSSEASVSTAKASLDAARQSAKAADFTVKSSEASLKETKTNLKRTTLYAPNSGIVSALNIEQGERVVGTAQMAGTELMRIANLNAMEVRVDVTENDVLRVSVGDQVDIEVDAHLDKKFKGKVTEIANSASNSGTGSLTTDQVTNFAVKIGIDPTSYQHLIKPAASFPLRSGMSASVDINTHTEENTLSIPIQSVTTRDGGPIQKKGEASKQVKEVVFLYNGGSAKMVEVKTGIQDDDNIQILSGLSEGDEVVTGPYAAVARKLKDGAKLRAPNPDEQKKKEK